MKAYELSKQGDNYNRGRIMMVVEGTKEQVAIIEKILDVDFNNTQCEEEGSKAGEVSVSYVIDRNEKPEFMAAYKAAKKSVK